MKFKDYIFLKFSKKSGAASSYFRALQIFNQQISMKYFQYNIELDSPIEAILLRDKLIYYIFLIHNTADFELRFSSEVITMKSYYRKGWISRVMKIYLDFICEKYYLLPLSGQTNY